MQFPPQDCLLLVWASLLWWTRSSLGSTWLCWALSSSLALSRATQQTGTSHIKTLSMIQISQNQSEFDMKKSSSMFQPQAAAFKVEQMRIPPSCERWIMWFSCTRFDKSILFSQKGRKHIWKWRFRSVRLQRRLIWRSHLFLRLCWLWLHCYNKYVS